jgi:hypothetical protein
MIPPSGLLKVDTLVSTNQNTLFHNVQYHNINQLQFLAPKRNLQLDFLLDLLNIESGVYLRGFSPTQQCVLMTMVGVVLQIDRRPEHRLKEAVPVNRRQLVLQWNGTSLKWALPFAVIS